MIRLPPFFCYGRCMRLAGPAGSNDQPGRDDGAGSDDLFDDRSVIAALDRRAAEDIAANRLLAHEAVLHWLGAWGQAPRDRPAL